MNKDYLNHMYGSKKIFDYDKSRGVDCSNSYTMTTDSPGMFGTVTNSHYEKGNAMKKCNVCLPDGDGKISIGEGCICISPTTTGFLIFSNPNGIIEIHACRSFDEVLKYMAENTLLDQTENAIAINI